MQTRNYKKTNQQIFQLCLFFRDIKMSKNDSDNIVLIKSTNLLDKYTDLL